MALTEDATGLNIADGDDIIQMGNIFDGNVKIYGQGGNDKLIGGFNDQGGTQTEFLFGGSGDDKIWMVAPENRALEFYFRFPFFGIRPVWQRFRYVLQSKSFTGYGGFFSQIKPYFPM